MAVTTIDGLSAYRFFDDGRIQSRARMGRPAIDRPRMWAGWRDIHPYFKKGHFHVTLKGDDGSFKPYLVGHLILTAFVGPRPPRTLCIHRDGDRANNHLDNLRWSEPGSPEDASARTTSAKLGVDAVLEIRGLHRQGMSQREIAGRFGVTPQCVGLIVRGEIWKFVSEAI